MAGKTSKYRAKGGMVKRMGGGKTSKYRAKGGTVSKMGGGMIGLKRPLSTKPKVVLLKKWLEVKLQSIEPKVEELNNGC